MRAHVLFIVEGLPYPMDVRVRAQTAALLEAGYRVTVAGPTGYGHEALEEQVEGVRALRFRAKPSRGGAAGYMREYATAWLALRRIVRRVLREDPFDLAVVCNPPDALAEITRPLRRRGVKVVFDYREICPELYEAKFGRRGLLHRLLLASERRALRSADTVITVSDACAELAQERGGVDRLRTFLVGNGPDPQRIHAVPPRPELRAGRPHLVLWLGAMSRQEGLDRLIEAAHQVVHRRGHRDVGFALVGPGDAHDALRGEIRRRGLDEWVTVSGPVDDDLVRAYISTADVCVGVDVKGAMNDRAAMRKVLEYMAVGRPVVQFPLAQMQRLCGDATVYARNADAGDLADRIADLIADEGRRAALGAAARARVEGLMWPQQVPAFLHAVSTALESSETVLARPVGEQLAG
jgi:glycosyltransferase involved in cell wall biosynthesis